MSTTMQVYVKTPKGIEEMSSRSFGLSPKSRRVLIMVDGKRDGAEISTLFEDVDAAAILAELVAAAFIVPLNAVSSTTVTDKKPVEQTPAPADDAQRFEMAKSFMLNTIKAFLGSMGSGLANQIERCTNLEQLRTHYKAWRESIGMTRDGRKQLAELEKRLAALLS